MQATLPRVRAPNRRYLTRVRVRVRVRVRGGGEW